MGQFLGFTAEFALFLAAFAFWAIVVFVVFIVLVNVTKPIHVPLISFFRTLKVMAKPQVGK